MDQYGNHSGIHYHVISDRERYIRADKGGAIYYLDSVSFECDESQDDSSDEWTSTSAVIPIDKEVYASGLQAQLDYGVQIYFVDTDTYRRIIEAGKDLGNILRTLTSENQRLGL